MNVSQIAEKAGVGYIAVRNHLEGLGIHDVTPHTMVAPLFAECVITTLKPLDITRPSWVRRWRWLLGRI